MTPRPSDIRYWLAANCDAYPRVSPTFDTEAEAATWCDIVRPGDLGDLLILMGGPEPAPVDLDAIREAWEASAR